MALVEVGCLFMSTPQVKQDMSQEYEIMPYSHLGRYIKLNCPSMY